MMAVLPDALLPGRPEQLGAQVCAEGVRFAVFSQRAERIELCLFNAGGDTELRRYPLHGPDDGVFHGLLPGAGTGLLYGYRAFGEYRPEHGRRFNPNKLLLDPYARAIEGEFSWQEEHHGCLNDHPEGDRHPDPRDNAATALKSRVLTDPGPAPALANRPRRPLAESVLYELHVKGFSMALPGIPDTLRGRFAALAHPAAIAHFKKLGVTTLSLLPVQQSLTEKHLYERGLRNYWGYNPIGFFCPEPGLASGTHIGEAVDEFRQMVHALHANGLEVIIDVVFNHTAEGDAGGPTLGFRGLDNASWYMLSPDDRSHYENHSGCGNTLRVAHPRVTQFVMDVLRFWVERMGVDGFRFDLAPVLGRTRQGFDPSAPFFTALRQDPVLASVHWIAEPWDTGAGGYQLGRFPGKFLEWNDRFRDAVRGYWLGKGISRGEFARRFTGSSDIFHHGARQPTASVNFVAAHDGFTLADTVSYAHKHNAANGEDNRDGHSHETSVNCGVEGDTDEAGIRATRLRLRRAMQATVLLAQGTPMLCAGDEFGNSQGGNNNAYCQDNPTGWLDWTGLANDAGGMALVSRLTALRQADPLLRHARWFAAGNGPQLHWHRPDGGHMQIADWHDRMDSAFACVLEDDAGQPRWCVVFNPGPEAHDFRLAQGPWRKAFDSSQPECTGGTDFFENLSAPAHSLLLLAGVTLSQEHTP
jgi:glycogen operon protein